MILINSIPGDGTTDQVIRWLRQKGEQVLRLNGEALVEEIEATPAGWVLHIAGYGKLALSDISGYWYRRGNFRMPMQAPTTGIADFDEVHTDYLIHEKAATLDFVLHQLQHHPNGIGDVNSCTNVNKNIILEQAKALGMSTPAYIITRHKREAEAFVAAYPLVITKPIHASLVYSTDEHWYPTYTEAVTSEWLRQMPQQFEPTLFQQGIEKKWEIRTFYLRGECYSMAIFSQNDAQTQTDFRKYNDAKPNRTVPFRLPEGISQQVSELMDQLRWDSGSLDFIYTHDGEYVFLEVNPIGQLGMVSYPCHYHLEKKIAEALCQQ